MRCLVLLLLRVDASIEKVDEIDGYHLARVPHGLVHMGAVPLDAAIRDLAQRPDRQVHLDQVKVFVERPAQTQYITLATTFPS